MMHQIIKQRKTGAFSLPSSKADVKSSFCTIKKLHFVGALVINYYLPTKVADLSLTDEKDSIR